MRINTNVASLNAMESASTTNYKLTGSLEKLSSGLRINKASDDASGLAIADKLRTQASSIGQSISNGNSAVALTQIADKAMAEQSNILDIVKTKLVQAATDTTSGEGRESIAKDILKLLNQLNNIASQTNYNGTKLLETDALNPASTLTFQIGENLNDTISGPNAVQSNLDGLSIITIWFQANVNYPGADNDAFFNGEGDPALIRSYLDDVDSALNTLNGWRADFGSTQNQLESAIRNQMTQQTNIKNAESIIRDVDYASESANFNKQNIISQAGTYAMSQANSIQQNITRLLQ